VTSTRPIAVLEILHFDLAFDGDAEHPDATRGTVTIEVPCGLASYDCMLPPVRALRNIL